LVTFKQPRVGFACASQRSQFFPGWGISLGKGSKMYLFLVNVFHRNTPSLCFVLKIRTHVGAKLDRLVADD